MNETSDMDRSIQMSLQNFHSDSSVDHLSHMQSNGTDEAYRQFYQRLHVREPEKIDDLRHIPASAPDLIKTEHNNMPSSSSSLVSQPSPLAVSGHGEMLDDVDSQKRRRTSIIDQVQQNNHQQSDNDEQSSADVGDSEIDLQRSPSFPSDFLYPFYQHAQRQIRNSEQLLGELVTSELLKMTKERKRIAQKKILEILFFDD